MATYIMTTRLFLSCEENFPLIEKQYRAKITLVETLRLEIDALVDAGKQPSVVEMNKLEKEEKRLAHIEKEITKWGRDGFKNPLRKREVIRYLNNTGHFRDKITDVIAI
jgi:hypothetical protein